MLFRSYAPPYAIVFPGVAAPGSASTMPLFGGVFFFREPEDLRHDPPRARLDLGVAGQLPAGAIHGDNHREACRLSGFSSVHARVFPQSGASEIPTTQRPLRTPNCHPQGNPQLSSINPPPIFPLRADNRQKDREQHQCGQRRHENNLFTTRFPPLSKGRSLHRRPPMCTANTKTLFAFVPWPEWWDPRCSPPRSEKCGGSLRLPVAVPDSSASTALLAIRFLFQIPTSHPTWL